MAKKTLSGWEILFSPDLLLPFVFSAVALGILGNAVFSLLTNWLTSSDSALIRISIGAFLSIILFGWLLKHFLYNRQIAAFSMGKKKPDQRKGLILLISNILTAKAAIQFHKELLTHCWLVCSESSEKSGIELKNQYENESTEFTIIPINDQDVFDPLIFKNEIEKIYSNLPSFFSEQDIIVDFTGMTAVASVGAVLACVGKDRPMQYVPAPYSQKLKAVQPLEPIEIELN